MYSSIIVNEDDDHETSTKEGEEDRHSESTTDINKSTLSRWKNVLERYVVTQTSDNVTLNSFTSSSVISTTDVFEEQTQTLDFEHFSSAGASKEEIDMTTSLSSSSLPEQVTSIESSSSLMSSSSMGSPRLSSSQISTTTVSSEATTLKHELDSGVFLFFT